MTFWHNQKKLILAKLEEINDGVSRDEEIRKHNKAISKQIKVKDFIRNSAEVAHEMDFEKNCIILSAHTTKSVKEMTTKEYFTLLAYHNDKLKRDGRQSHKTR